MSGPRYAMHGGESDPDSNEESILAEPGDHRSSRRNVLALLAVSLFASVILLGGLYSHMAQPPAQARHRGARSREDMELSEVPPAAAIDADSSRRSVAPLKVKISESDFTMPATGMLGLAAELGSEAKAVSVGKENCNETRACATAGTLCYEQSESYAQCRASCVKGPDPTHWDGKPWSCKELGPRTPGDDPCGVPGEDCRSSRCCRSPGMTCFEKNASWSTCKAECIPGAPDFADVDSTPWTCKRLGETASGTADWVHDQCVDGYANCVTAGCCKHAGHQCFKQNDYFGMCKLACTDPGWSCGTVGSRTPAPPPTGARMPEWAMSTCAAPETGCLESRCCIGMDVQCYEKSEGWAQCKESCTPGAHADDNNETWSCKPLGPRSYGVSTKGFPSLYCFSVLRVDGYEAGLLRAQWERKAGIFACDDYSLLTADGSTKIGDVETISFPGAPITVSVDNTAGNTELFLHAWNAIIAAGVWKNHTFTMKVDPDAVLVADRARWHLLPQVGKKIYVVNCPKGDMMYGALEVFSYYGIKDWAARGHSLCSAPNNWGEDKYMTNCMDSLGVARVHDESIIADALCLGAGDCSDGRAAAFHPFKDVGRWLQCWDRATGTSPGTIAV